MDTVSRTAKPRGWTRARIMRELTNRGIRPAALAREMGRARSTVSEVIAGNVVSLPVASAVSAALGRQPHEIWPRLYAPPPSGEPRTEPTAEPAPTALAS